MDFFVTIIFAYLLMCAALPALIARRRGLSAKTQLGIAVFGALTGWTGFGAIAAWLFALFDDPKRAIVIIR